MNRHARRADGCPLALGPPNIWIGRSRAFASLVEAAGDRFEEALEIVEDYLRPVADLDTFAFRMTKDGADGKNYSGRFPAAALRMLDKLGGPDRQTAPWNIGELLETVATARPRQHLPPGRF